MTSNITTVVSVIISQSGHAASPKLPRIGLLPEENLTGVLLKSLQHVAPSQNLAVSGRLYMVRSEPMPWSSMLYGYSDGQLNLPQLIHAAATGQVYIHHALSYGTV